MSSKQIPELFEDAKIIQQKAAATRDGFQKELRAVRAGVDELRATLDRAPRHAIHQESAFALRESERKLRLALDAADLGIWRWDAGKGTKEMQWDSRCRQLFGVPQDARVTYETWTHCIVPEDRAQAEANVARALDPGDPHDETVCEFQVQHPDGMVLWLCSTGRAFFEPDAGSPSGRRVTFKSGTIRDVTNVHLAEAALRESEERFRSVFENAATGIVITDMENRFQSCNPAYSAMLGYSEDELRQFPFSTLVYPEDREANVLQKNRLAAQEIPSFETVNRYLRRDGKIIWVRTYVSLLRDAVGMPINILVLVTDISERKRQEDKIGLLMREVNHRSKNMLSLVQAVARQTLAANPEDFLDRFERRVEALAANQDLLVKNAWKGADLDELVRSQLALFEDLIGTRIALQGPPVFVSASAAQTIGMAIHELATNAGKYGALSGSDGWVGIAWHIYRDEWDEETFIMTWGEKCTHPITVPSKLGFGTSVISSMAEMSLGGKVELNFPETGLTWQLSCAAEEVVDGDIRPKDETEGTASGVAPMSQRLRILVVEDEPVVAIEIARVLTEAGFEIVGPAKTVHKALELLKRGGCNAAVLDINLGSETSEAIAVALTPSKTPFVVLSGYARNEYPSVFAGAPALMKPIRPQSLIAELRK